MRIRSLISSAFRRCFFIKRKRTFEYLGYSNKDLFDHLKKFLQCPCVVCGLIFIEMNNSHIDHIIPVCVAKSEEDIIKLNQLYNLRLICKKCNLNKISSDLQMKKEVNNDRME